jgi:hypothetical protein
MYIGVSKRIGKGLRIGAAIHTKDSADNGI